VEIGGFCQSDPQAGGCCGGYRALPLKLKWIVLQVHLAKQPLGDK
jgi:hypothetical protein